MYTLPSYYWFLSSILYRFPAVFILGPPVVGRDEKLWNFVQNTIFPYEASIPTDLPRLRVIWAFPQNIWGKPLRNSLGRSCVSWVETRPRRNSISSKHHGFGYNSTVVTVFNYVFPVRFSSLWRLPRFEVCRNSVKIGLGICVFNFRTIWRARIDRQTFSSMAPPLRP